MKPAEEGFIEEKRTVARDEKKLFERLDRLYRAMKKEESFNSVDFENSYLISECFEKSNFKKEKKAFW